VTVENDDSELEHWKTEPHFAEVVGILRKDMVVELQTKLDETACFGHAWVDDDGTCPLAEKCVLSSFCVRAWNMVQVIKGQNARANPYVAANTGSIATPSRARPLVDKSRPNRGKFVDRPEYDRNGYQDLGRPVDAIIAAFVSAVGDPPRLPLKWNKGNFDEKYGHLGPVVISAPKNYHALLHKGRTAVRLHTFCVGHANVDIAPELVDPIRLATAALDPAKDGGAQVTQPQKIPPGSREKLAPCLHRVKVRTPEGAEALARVVRSQYGF
jgi:hypothetical protein